MLSLKQAWKRTKKDVQPDAVPEYVDLAGLVDDGPYDRVPLGRGPGGSAVRLDLSEDPHLLISSAAGQGSTSFLTGVGAWLSSRGAEVEVCDSRQVSFDKSLAGLPGVRIHRDANEQCAAIEQCRAEMEARYARLGDPDMWPRVLLLDGLSSLLTLSRHTARRRGDKDENLTDDLIAILTMGRGVRCHVVAAAGVHAARSLIEHFPARLAIGPQSRVHQFVVFGSAVDSWRPDIRGRALLAKPDEVYPQEIQVAHSGPQWVCEYARSGGLLPLASSGGYDKRR